MQEETVRQVFKKRLTNLAMQYRIEKSDSNADTVDKLLRKIKNKQTLKDDYESIVKDLTHKKTPECISTPAEQKFFEKFKELWKVKLYRQVWVGNIAVDFFTPAFGVLRKQQQRGYPLKGIGFEIDGPIHNLESKAKKDLHKEKSLNDLGILVWRFTNDNVYAGINILCREKVLQEFGILCSRARARLWQRIYLTTILYHGSVETLQMYFKTKQINMTQGKTV